MSNVLHFTCQVYPRTQRHPKTRVSYRSTDRFGLLYLAAINVDGTKGLALVVNVDNHKEEAETRFSYYADCRLHADDLKRMLCEFAEKRELQSQLDNQVAIIRNERDNIRAKSARNI